jgi:D-sedoheptulose 7-phosphate isomerase
MSTNNFFISYFNEISNQIHNIDDDILLATINKINEIKQKPGKIIIIGNGGSAAIASHVSIDLTKAANIRTINFNEASLLTCFSNDYGYEHWVEKAIEFYADSNDLVILISSSGQSKNIINGAKKAKEMKLHLITLSGFLEDNPLRSMGDINLWVDSTKYNMVENTHQIWLLSVVDYLIETGQSKE